MTTGFILVVLACLFGLMMTWGVGANDLANILSTSIGSHAIPLRRALIIAIIFEFAGAIFGGEGVSNTLRNGIINIQLLAEHPNTLVYGMLSVLLAGTVWILSASYFGLPVSITNAIVGAIVGFGMVVLGVNDIYWSKVGFIALSWILSPTLAGVAAYLLFISVQYLILGALNPFKQAKRYVAIYLLLASADLANMVLLKGLKHFHIALTPLANVLLMVVTAVMVLLLTLPFIARIKLQGESRRENLQKVEQIFSILMMLTACAMVFAHGSNDVAIAVGPMSIVINIIHQHDMSALRTPLSFWIVLLGCTGVILGLIMYGRKVIETVGSHITALTPSRAFSATLAAATTVVFSTSTGIPVSATQTLVGGVLGVGLARGIDALNLGVIRNIFLSWIVTLPVASLLAIGFYYLFKIIFAV